MILFKIYNYNTFPLVFRYPCYTIYSIARVSEGYLKGN